VELQISKIYSQICELYQHDQHVSFLHVIISPDADGIVRTLLYLLHLTNRKQIELWQKLPASEETPIKKSKKSKMEEEPNASNSKNEHSYIVNEEINAGNDIFITPIFNITE
jgi:chromatin segregation and condensation protein Rec8/ScpA/Scc1 (kleisin family)